MLVEDESHYVILVEIGGFVGGGAIADHRVTEGGSGAGEKLVHGFFEINFRLF
jgi:predicted NBD/HSP70 family sugar kinase